MDYHILPTITMVAGSTHPVQFRVSDYMDYSAAHAELVGHFSVSEYVNPSDDIKFSLEKQGIDENGFLKFVIPSDQTKDLNGKYIYQVHITDDTEHEFYHGYMVIIKNRNKGVLPAEETN